LSSLIKIDLSYAMVNSKYICLVTVKTFELAVF
jgi:hypothetical protein